MIAFFAVMLAAVAAPPDAPAEVRLRSTVSCSSTVVRVADVADVVASDARLGQAIAEVPLCPAPPAGRERTLTAHDVQQMLALSGIERGECRVSGSEQVSIGWQAISASTAARRPVVATGVRQAIFTEQQPGDRSGGRPANVVSKQPESPPKPAAAPLLVERGATVTIIARAAGVRITASGKALEGGAAGDAINVELADTKQRVLAKVSGPQTVELAAGGL